MDNIIVHGMPREAHLKSFIVAVTARSGRETEWWYREAYDDMMIAMEAAGELHGTVIPIKMICKKGSDT